MYRCLPYEALDAARAILHGALDSTPPTTLLAQMRLAILQPFSPSDCPPEELEGQQMDLLFTSIDLWRLGDIKDDLNRLMLLLKKPQLYDKNSLMKKLQELMQVVSTVLPLQQTPTTIQQFLDAGYTPVNGVIPASSKVVRFEDGFYVRAELPFLARHSNRINTWFVSNPKSCNGKGGQGEVIPVVPVSTTEPLTAELFKIIDFKIKEQYSKCNTEVRMSKASGVFALPLTPVKKGIRTKNCFLSQFTPGTPLDLFLEKEVGRKLSIQKILFIISDLAYQLGYYVEDGNKERWIHGDFKLNNVILNEDTLKPTIIDFGMAQMLGLRVKSAPEYWTPMEEVANDKYDIFSLAIALCQMLSGFNIEAFCGRYLKYRGWYAEINKRRTAPSTKDFDSNLTHVLDALPPLADVASSLQTKYSISYGIATCLANLCFSMLKLDIADRASFAEVKSSLASITQKIKEMQKVDPRFVFDPSQVVCHSVASLTFADFMDPHNRSKRKRQVVSDDGTKENDFAAAQKQQAAKPSAKRLLFSQEKSDTRLAADAVCLPKLEQVQAAKRKREAPSGKYDSLALAQQAEKHGLFPMTKARCSLDAELIVDRVVPQQLQSTMS